MTIGIGATGEDAGLAVWRALGAAERVCHGSIRGFATFAVVTDDGEARHYGTQRGGSTTLFTDGETVLDRPPAEVRAAPVAGVISSGPDRPDPLSQFLPARDGVGLVTGHRIPNAPGDDGEPLNERVLDRMADGTPADRAVEAVLDAHPTADAGLIAVDTDGTVASANSEKVADRPDVAHRLDRTDGGAVAVLHNQIDPDDLASRVASATALATMSSEPEPELRIRLDAGLEVELGDEDRAYVDDDDVVVRVTTTDPTLVEGEAVGVAPYFLSPVVRDGEVVGEVVDELATVFEDGVIQSLSGADSATLDVRRV